MTKDIYSQSISFSNSSSNRFLILFLLWPFLAFITALLNYSKKESRMVAYIFLIYYGLTFVITNQGVDAAGYALSLKANALLPFSDFFKIVGGIYANDTSVDVVEPLLSFMVSRFTDDHRILFAVFAAVFGFFYLKSINLLYDRYKENSGLNSLIHLIFFTLLIPITFINGFRMWTAAWIFFYGAYQVMLQREAKYLLIALASSLVHWSFLSANVVLIIYYFAGNRNFIYMPLAFASFVVPKLFSPLFQSISLRLGGGLQSRYENYSNEDYMTYRLEELEQAPWFLQLVNDLVLYYLLLSIIVIQLRFGYLMKGKTERNLFSFLLLFLSFVNFGKAIPSFGGRFMIVFFLFALSYVFLFYVKLSGSKINLLTFIGLFPMLLYTVVEFRQVSVAINAWILTPGLGLPLLVQGLSVEELLFH